jgi:molybdopterin-guanine dinucleotide biosynthesis protein A
MASECVSGVVLAGGKGSRLGGVNKALLEVAGLANIERVLAALRPLCQELVLITNDQLLATLPNVRMVLDLEPHAGVLPALAQGLDTVTGDLAVVVACDMPFLNTQLLAEQVRRASECDVVIPVLEDRPEPMHAVYRRQSSLAAIHHALAQGQRRMISFLDDLRVIRLEEKELRLFDPDLLSFFNTNTSADLAKAQELAATARGRPRRSPG